MSKIKLNISAMLAKSIGSNNAFQLQEKILELNEKYHNVSHDNRGKFLSSQLEDLHSWSKSKELGDQSGAWRKVSVLLSNCIKTSECITAGDQSAAKKHYEEIAKSSKELSYNNPKKFTAKIEESRSKSVDKISR
jgi:hypothetical protein